MKQVDFKAEWGIHEKICSKITEDQWYRIQKIISEDNTPVDKGVLDKKIAEKAYNEVMSEDNSKDGDYHWTGESNKELSKELSKEHRELKNKNLQKIIDTVDKSTQKMDRDEWSQWYDYKNEIIGDDNDWFDVEFIGQKKYMNGGYQKKDINWIYVKRYRRSLFPHDKI